MKNFKSISLLIIIVMLFTSVSVMAQTTLEVWHRGDIAYNEAYTELAERFNEENPDIEVNFVLYPQLSDKLITAGMGGSLPDAWIMDTVTTGSWIKNDFVQKINKDEFSDEILEVAWETTKGADGNYYGIPWSVQGMAMHYRKDWFENLNLDVPETWEELVEVSKKLTNEDPDNDGEDNTYGIGLYGASMRGYGYWTLQNFLWQAGGSFVKQTEDGKFVANLDNEATREALHFIHDLVYKHEVVPPGASSANSDQVYSQFQNGLVGMVFHANYKTIAYRQALEEENKGDIMGSAIMPAGPEGSYALGEGENIYISADTDKYEEVIKLAKYMTTEETQEYGMKNDISALVRLSVRKDVDVVEVTEDPFNKAFQDAFLGGNIKYPENVPDYYPIKMMGAQFMQDVLLTEEENPQFDEMIEEYNTKINEELEKQGVLGK